MAKKDKKVKEPTENGQYTEDFYAKQNRRYVGTKETVGYVIFDMAQSFNINTYSERFITTIFKLDLGMQAVANLINSIWDIVNDTFSGALVDKTRTRWGKFKPYLIVLGVPGTLATCLYWLMPLLFPNASSTSMAKFFFYLVLAILRETGGTFRGFAQTGMLATITPNPIERTRLITQAQFFSGFLGEKLPQQIMDVVLDLIGNQFVGKGNFDTAYKSVFIGMGVFTSLVSGIAALWFATITKERVMQSIESPSIKEGIKSIVNNKPILILTLSDTLSSFSLFSGSKQDYFIDVLNFATLGTIVGIPGAIVHPFSYTLVPWFRKRFSTRALAILGKYSIDITYIPVFLIGCIGGKKNGLYKKVLPMGIALCLQETFYMFFYGLRHVIPSEMYNEAMDYCEWKNGYRTEAMTSAAKGLAQKLATTLSGFVKTLFKKWIGYDINAYTRGTAQSDDTKFWLFAMFTVLPLLTTTLGIIPLLFYDLSGKKRDKMYEELLARRALMASEVTDGDTEALDKVKAAQKAVAAENKTDNDLN